MSQPRVLVVDDERDVRLSFSLYLSRAGFAVEEADSLETARQAVVTRSVDCVLLDLNLPDGNGMDWIRDLRENQPATAILVITGRGDIPLAVEAMRRGADHFLTKPPNMGEVEVFIRKSLELGGLRRGHAAQRRLARSQELFLGDGAVARQLRELLALAAENDAPVLLLGETGTGKGVLARWIHEHGVREAMPFVEVSCSALHGELLASELFGHARGAFTSAVADRQGLLDVSDGGTLFLDEVGELTPSVQSQFLKVLEEKRYRRLGEVRERRSEFRLICATNRPLGQDVESGRFRQDLHFRINVFPIRVPALRERTEEIPALSAHLLRSLGAASVPISPEAMALLRGYAWPGNVRELRNTLERALLLSRRGPIEPAHLAWLESARTPGPGSRPGPDETARIRRAIEQADGHVGEAARALGLSRATLYRRLQRLRGR